ncbi:hypothetical protein [Hydrogenophaga crocea]|uniref:hypothetical protein n=1 Tax=Hydrogenophaga crocea TaxID=2716225 RepID=UPI00196A618A|nr:hypothetical protein [Hydrogenophaga crocea]
MPHDPRRAPRRSPGARALRLGCALALSALAGACAVTPLPPAQAPRARRPPPPHRPAHPRARPRARVAPASAPAASSATPGAAQPPAPAAAPALAEPAAPAPTLAPSLVMPAPNGLNANEATAALLRYADRVRALTPAELALEIAALGDPGNQPARQLQLALALASTSQAVDTARALGLAQRAANSNAADATPYRPIARLIAHRLLEQRKLEENIDRQAQQLREQQRRIDLLNERLEAMRAIERSLNNRTPATAPRPPSP